MRLVASVHAGFIERSPANRPKTGPSKSTIPPIMMARHLERYVPATMQREMNGTMKTTTLTKAGSYPSGALGAPNRSTVGNTARITPIAGSAAAH